MYDALALRLIGVRPTTGRVGWPFGRPDQGPGEFGGVAKVTEDGRAGERVDFRVGINPRGVYEAGRSLIVPRSPENGEIERVGNPSDKSTREDLP